jgi:hypothetical protein
MGREKGSLALGEQSLKAFLYEPFILHFAEMRASFARVRSIGWERRTVPD